MLTAGSPVNFVSTSLKLLPRN